MHRFLLVSSFFLVWISELNAQQPIWKLVTEHAAFSPRDGAGPFVYDGKMWLVGGWNEDSVPARNSEVWNSCDGANWNCVNAAAPWSARHCMGTVVYKNKMWIIGGDGNTDVWNSEDGITWNLITDTVPWGKRYKPYVLVFHDTIWLMGGFDYYNGNGIVYNDVWYTVDGASWVRATADAGWPGRGIIHGKVVFDDKMWILGGGLYFMPGILNETYYNDVWSSPDGIHWTRILKHAPWLSRMHHSIEVFDNKMWVMAGHNKNHPTDSSYLRNDVWYSSDGVTWTELLGTPWAPTHAASIYIYDSALWLSAGFLRNEVWKLYYPENPPQTVHPGDIFYVYPNPASDIVNIIPMADSAITVSAKIQLYNELGKLIYECEIEASKKHPYLLNVSDYKHGLYLIRFYATEIDQVIKIIIF
jgi:hypothetical protein